MSLPNPLPNFSSIPDLGLLSGDHGTPLNVQQRFTMFEAVGAGAFATVYRAQDKVLGRIVALKLPHVPISLLPESWRRRFLTELRASAALHHPNIVTAFDAGSDQQRCFLVSEFVTGRTLTQWLVDQSQAIALKIAAELVAQLADGVQLAHETGILHRDLKPSNILIDEAKPRGNLAFTPRITDFGMARFHEADATISQDGTVLGSPAYMSPEQALGQSSQLGPGTDVYSLGVILYQLLTGETPFRDSTSVELMRAVVHDDPRPPRQIRADIPHDLEAICLACLEKKPSHRYATARDLAADLRCFLNDVPVGVRSPNTVERIRRWTIRHPAWSSVIATVVVSISLVVALLLQHGHSVGRLNAELSTSNSRLGMMNRQLSTALRDSRFATEQAEDEKLRALETVYAYDIGRAFEAWKKFDVQELRAIVMRYADAPPNAAASDAISRAALRGPEWFWLNRQFRRDSREITQLPRAVYRMAISPDGQQLVVAGLDDVIRVVELASGKTLSEWPAQQMEVNGLAFAPDGQTLWSAGDDGTVRCWNVAARSEVLRFDAHPGHHVFEVLYDARRDLLITCGNEPVIRLWDPRTGEARGTLEGHTKSIDVIVPHPDGRRLFSGSTDHTIRVWDLDARTGDKLTRRTKEKVFALAVSDDGRFLAAGMAHGQLLVWDLERNEPLMDGKLKDTIDRVRFDRSGDRVFAIDFNSVMWEWPVPSPGSLVTELSPPAQVWHNGSLKPYDVQLSPDGRDFLMARKDGGVRAIPLAPSPTEDATLRFSIIRDFACLSPNRIAVAEDRQLQLIDDVTVPDRIRVLDENGPWSMIIGSSDGSLLAAKNRNGEIGVWQVADGKRLIQRGAVSAEAVSEMSFSQAGNELAIANRELSRVEVVDPRTGATKRHLEANTCVHALFSENGQVLAYDGFPDATATARELRLVDWPSGNLRATVPSRSIYLGTLALSPDGRWLAISGDRTVNLYDTQTGRMVHELFGHRGTIRKVVFSPDSRRLATAGADEGVKLWHVTTGQYLLEFSAANNSPATDCEFTADGCGLAFATEDHAIHFIRLAVPHTLQLPNAGSLLSNSVSSRHVP